MSLKPLLSSPLLSSSVKQGIKYQYRIQVEVDGHLSDFSPPLLHTHGQPYCGDGVIQGLVHLNSNMTIYKEAVQPQIKNTCFYSYL